MSLYSWGDMKNTTKFSVLFVIIFGFLPKVYAEETVKNSLTFDFATVLGFIVVVSVIFCCIKGVRSCFKTGDYKYFSANYFTEKMDERLYQNMSSFDKESANRVKKLMETQKRNNYVKASTINQIKKINNENDKLVSKV